MAGINFIRRWVMSQMKKTADDGIMITLPDKNKVDLILFSNSKEVIISLPTFAIIFISLASVEKELHHIINTRKIIFLEFIIYLLNFGDDREPNGLNVTLNIKEFSGSNSESL